VIYGRFGFGLASDSIEFYIDSARSAFNRSFVDPGVRLIDTDEARKVLPELWERTRRARAGEPNRSPEFWEEYFDDEPSSRHGGSALFFAVCDDGYTSYRASPEDEVLRGVRVPITVEELWGSDAETEAALWRFVLDLDLVGTVTFRRRPVDEAVRWRLKDPRQLRTRYLDDRIYLRVLDVPATLESRGYRSEGRLVIDVRPADVPSRSDPAVGAWSLEAGPDGSSCAPAGGASPDLRMRVTDLGSIYLGGVKASTLAAAGLVEELTPGGLDRADRLFGGGPAPSTVTGF
jgi:predicted acetyltransferase